MCLIMIYSIMETTQQPHSEKEVINKSVHKSSDFMYSQKITSWDLQQTGTEFAFCKNRNNMFWDALF